MYLLFQYILRANVAVVMNFCQKKKIVFTFSPNEWKQIQPHQVFYKLNDKSRNLQDSRSYNALPKNIWTPILHEHFWIHTHLPWCLSSRKAKVYPTRSTYIVVIGRCTICNSQFKGIVEDKPPARNTRYS